MRDDVYKEFSTKMKAIIKDCMVTKDVAHTDLETYTAHQMTSIPNAGNILYYNRKKIIDKYSADIKNLFSIIPQRKNPTSLNRNFVDLSSLISNSAFAEKDKEKRQKILKAQSNIIEAFFAFAEETRLGTISTRTKLPVFTLNQKISTRYQETPADQEPNI